MGLTFFNTKPLLFLTSCFFICSLLSSCNGDFEEKYEQLKQDKEALVTQIEILEAQLSHAQREIRLLKRKLPEEPTTIDLIQLIKKLTPQLSWWTETENNSPLVWNHAGLIDGDNGFAFKREGKALVSLGGKVIEEKKNSLRNVTPSRSILIFFAASNFFTTPTKTHSAIGLNTHGLDPMRSGATV